MRTATQPDKVKIPLTLFLASPSDTARDVVERAVSEVGSEPEYRDKVELDLQRWDDRSKPAPMAFLRCAQEQVETYKTPPKHCDLVISLLRHRLGSPLGNERKYGISEVTEQTRTGTEWELFQATQHDIETWVIRDMSPFVNDPSSSSNEGEAQWKQYNWVCRFFELIGPPGHTHKGADELEALFKRLLREWLSKLLDSLSQIPLKPDDSVKQIQLEDEMCVARWPMWISYAGKDSATLVDALEEKLKPLCPQLEINRYKKLVNVEAKLTEEDKEKIDKKTDNEWPVYLKENKFHLIPMEELFELVVEIAYSSRVLVILSPAYFQSSPCLQELASLICLENRPLPLFVLNGITHEEVRLGQITIKDAGSNSEKTIDLPVEIARARAGLTQLDSIGFFKKLAESEAKEYLSKLAGRNVPATVLESLPNGGGENESLKISNTDEVAKNIKAYFIEKEGAATYHKVLRAKDYKRFEHWFGRTFGRSLLDEIKNENSNEMTAESIVQELLDGSYDIHERVMAALSRTHAIKFANPPNVDNAKADWNTGISELAGLYTLTLIDYETLATIGHPQASMKHEKPHPDMGLLYLRFPSGEYQASFQACVINSTVRQSMLCIKPSNNDESTGAPILPSYSVREGSASAGNNNSQFAREFVETLYSFVVMRSADLCPKGDPDHSTGMSESERRTLRGQVGRYQKKNGPGSLVLTIKREQFTSGNNWWDSFSEVHTALNDGALSHRKVQLRGIVISHHEDKNVATITMHPEYEIRLIHVQELLERYYLK